MRLPGQTERRRRRKRAGGGGGCLRDECAYLYKGVIVTAVVGQHVVGVVALTVVVKPHSVRANGVKKVLGVRHDEEALSVSV